MYYCEEGVDNPKVYIGYLEINLLKGNWEGGRELVLSLSV